jgi:hypothetical protein
MTALRHLPALANAPAMLLATARASALMEGRE